MTEYIDVQHINKIYHMGDTEIIANNDVSFTIKQGELTVILGPSGAGKSTILNILGGMDKATNGQLFVDGKNIADFNDRQLTDYRRTDVGFVFQFYNLIPTLTTKENVELASAVTADALDVEEVLTEVGLGQRMENFPSQLSGGEQQRVAIARALAKNPKLLLADEPTGALDFETGKQVLRLLQEVSRQKGRTVIIITHNAAIAPMADKVIHINDSRVQKIETNEHPTSIDEIEW